MFRKSLKLKTNTQLKASDRKKLRSGIASQFAITEDELNTIMPPKEAVTIIKLCTHNGAQVHAYSCRKVPIFFELEKMIYPTVYTMWILPNLLYTFTTIELVGQKILDGADLMLPGVILPENAPTGLVNFKKKDAVAVNTNLNKSALAIGYAALSSEDMFEAGRRGKCVIVLHTYKDNLWGLESTSNIPIVQPLSVKDNLLTIIKDSSQDFSEGDARTPPGEGRIVENMSGASSKEKVDEEGLFPKDSISDNEVVKSTELMDDLLMYCFYKSLTSSLKHAALPILANILYKVHILEACPAGSLLDIKKTRFRKLSVFLSEMQMLGVIKLEIVSKGVLSLASFDLSHQLVKDFLLSTKQEGSEKVVSGKTVKGLQGLEISEKFTVSANVLPIFSKFMYKKGDSVAGPEVRKIMTQYVRQENLQDATEKQRVMLDPILSSVLNTSEQYLTWETLMASVINKMGQCYRVDLDGNQVTKAKGKLPPIEIIVASRAGSKKKNIKFPSGIFGDWTMAPKSTSDHPFSTPTIPKNIDMKLKPINKPKFI